MRRTVFDADDVRYLLVLEDVTEREFALNQARHQKEELQASNEGLSQFAYIASHDLQEPLRKIRQFGLLLSDEYKEKLTGDGLYYIDVMNNASDRISNLVSDLLDYSRTSSADLALVPLNLQDLLEDVLIDLDVHINDSNASITSNNLPTVVADKVAVSHLFRNLISNAIKYQKAGSVPVINISASHQENKTFLHFEDNGIGMEGDIDQRLFEPFVRLEKRSEYPGNGIGLAICKTVCDRLDWGISYRSTLGVGTTFSLSIPKTSLLISETLLGKSTQH